MRPLSIFDCRLPIADLLPIENRKSKIGNHTFALRDAAAADSTRERASASDVRNVHPAAFR